MEHPPLMCMYIDVIYHLHSTDKGISYGSDCPKPSLSETISAFIDLNWAYGNHHDLVIGWNSRAQLRTQRACPPLWMGTIQMSQAKRPQKKLNSRRLAFFG